MQAPGTGQVTIVGTGLLGGSIGLALRSRGFSGPIVGVARRFDTLDAARRRGCIDRGITDLREAVADAELVILATPVGTILKLLPTLAPVLRRETIVTDVGSTKRSIVATAERVLQAPGRFVGSHPMAGSDQTGPTAADAELFAGKPAIVTPTARTDADALERVEQLWRQFGMRVHRMAAEAHDSAVARISHMPHAAAVMLVMLAEPDDLPLASTGFGDTTRIAAGDPQMWADIFIDNAEAIGQVTRQWQQHWRELEQAIARGDREALVQILETARRQRKAWEGE